MLMTVHERLEELIRAFFNDDELRICDDLMPTDVAGWDSIAHVNLMFSIEEAFGFQFSDDELEGISTIGQLEQIIERRLAA